MKQKRPCRQSGCPALTGHPTRYCEQHRPKDVRIPSKAYDQRWQQISKQYLAHHPICEGLYRDIDGSLKPCLYKSTHTDHIRGREHGDGWHNLQALCHSCHSKKTAKFDGGFGHIKKEKI